MSDLNINDLPREILTKIFRYLDVVNLKNATLTCKLWKNLIVATCRWSLHLRYGFHGKFWYKDSDSTKQKMNFILTTDRKFGTMDISEGRLTEDDQILQIFQRHGFNVVKLIINSSRITSLSAFANLLILTTNLKYAVIRSMKVHDFIDAPLDQVWPDLKMLKALQITDSDEVIIKCFRNNKLAAIEMSQYRHSIHDGPLADFILSQKMLTSLSSSLSILTEMGKLTVPIPFRLTQLKIIDTFDKKSAHYQDNFLSFVKTQSESLTELEVGWSVPSFIYECVFASMPKLNILDVSTHQIPRDGGFYERVKENGSVRTIQLLETGISDIQFLCNFLKKLPNISSLILPWTGNPIENTLVAVAQNSSQLESLFLEGIDERSLVCATFPNLKTLQIQYLHTKIDWNEFTKTHCRLTELTIETIMGESSLTSDDIDEITTNVDLQCIRLGDGFVADDRFFEIVRAKCTNLKVLDLHRSCISHVLKYNVGIKVLRLCDDFQCSKSYRSIFNG